MKVGIVGGGQLAQMMCLQAIPLGIQTLCLDPSEDCPASLVSPLLKGNLSDPACLARLAQQCDVLTYETENIDVNALKTLKPGVLRPSVEALEITQDRLSEKKFLKKMNLPVVPFASIETLLDAEKAMETFPFPSLLKIRRFGYDGNGQHIVRKKEDLIRIWQKLDQKPAILEEHVHFSHEYSLIAVRNEKPEVRFYPLTENFHRLGVLRLSKTPALSPEIEKKARKMLTILLTELQYIGVIAVEFFQVGNRLMVNEVAPRVHNSGHWTIEGSRTSQFNNHLRAVCGLPLGYTQQIRGKCLTLNCIGGIPPLESILPLRNTYLHDYHKTPRRGRKLGHVTIVDEYPARCEETAALCSRVIEGVSVMKDYEDY